MTGIDIPGCPGMSIIPPPDIPLIARGITNTIHAMAAIITTW